MGIGKVGGSGRDVEESGDIDCPRCNNRHVIG
jgi:hypothetical protein